MLGCESACGDDGKGAIGDAPAQVFESALGEEAMGDVGSELVVVLGPPLDRALHIDIGDCTATVAGNECLSVEEAGSPGEGRGRGTSSRL